YFSRVVDTFRICEFDSRVLAMVVNKPMLAGSVFIKPGDLPFVIDAQGACHGRPREIDNGVFASAVEETVFGSTTVLKPSDNVSFSIDAYGRCVYCAGYIDGRVDPVIVQEAV